MNQVTILAQVVDQLGLIFKQWTEIGDRGPDGYQRVHNRSRAARLQPDRFKPRQPPSTLNLMHHPGHTIGRLAALERASNGLWGIWSSDCIDLLRFTEPVYISAELSWQGTDVDAEQIEVRGAAIVDSTAATCTQPAVILCGDLSRKSDRDRWRVTPGLRAKLERAAEAQRRRRPDGVIYVHDEVRAQTLEAELRERERHAGPWGEQTWRGRPPGRIEHSPHRGRVISVT